MNLETTLRYSKPLLRDVVFAFCRRTVGISFLVALLFCGIGLVFLLAQGESSWVVGVFGSVFALGLLFVAVLYFTHYHNLLVKLRDMGSPNATFIVNDSTFTICSGSGKATLQWSVVKELWQTENAWLLLYSKAHFSTLPTDCLPPHMQDFIVQRVKAAGGRIVG